MPYKGLIFPLTLILLAFLSGFSGPLYGSDLVVVQDADSKVVAYVTSKGALLDASRNVIGYHTSSGAVQDRTRNVLGYVLANGKIKDSTYNTIGYVGQDGRVKDADLRTLGTINPRGKIECADLTPIGYFSGDIGRGRNAVCALLWFFKDEIGIDIWKATAPKETPKWVEEMKAEWEKRKKEKSHAVTTQQKTAKRKEILVSKDTPVRKGSPVREESPVPYAPERRTFWKDRASLKKAGRIVIALLIFGAAAIVLAIRKRVRQKK